MINTPLFARRPGNRAVESLNFRTADRILPALGLDVHLLKTEAIKRDDPVDATVARAPDSQEIGTTSAVTHLMEQIQDDRLEVLRRDLREQVEQFGDDPLSQF